MDAEQQALFDDYMRAARVLHDNLIKDPGTSPTLDLLRAIDAELWPLLQNPQPESRKWCETVDLLMVKIGDIVEKIDEQAATEEETQDSGTTE